MTRIITDDLSILHAAYNSALVLPFAWVLTHSIASVALCIEALFYRSDHFILPSCRCLDRTAICLPAIRSLLVRTLHRSKTKMSVLYRSFTCQDPLNHWSRGRVTYKAAFARIDVHLSEKVVDMPLFLCKALLSVPRLRSPFHSR